MPCQLNAVERNTAECQTAAIRRAMEKVPDLRAFEQDFPVRVRIPVIDGFTANTRGEVFLKSLQGKREGSKSLTTSFTCEVHKTANSTKKAMLVEDNTISGVVNLGLALEPSGSLQTLRSILQEVFLDELQVVYAEPPGGEVLRRRNAVLQTFLPIKAEQLNWKVNVRKRRFVLSYFANSDIRSDEIIHYCTWSCCHDWNQTLLHFQRYVVWALLPHNLPVLQRKSWTGSDRSLDWCGLLACHWNLLPKIIIKFVGKAQRSLVNAKDAADPDSGSIRHRAALESWTRTHFAIVLLFRVQIPRLRLRLRLSH